MPVIRIETDTFLQQVYGLTRLSGALRRFLRQEKRSVVVGDQQIGVEIGGDVQQGIEQIVVDIFDDVFFAEILHRPGPVDVRQQTAVAQTHTLQGPARGDVENVLERG